MHGTLFGELLGQLVALSRHDVDEILAEQSASRRRFGRVALALGLCQPRHVWRAWSKQLALRTPRLNPREADVDPRAASLLSRAVAAQFGVAPVRPTEHG